MSPCAESRGVSTEAIEESLEDTEHELPVAALFCGLVRLCLCRCDVCHLFPWSRLVVVDTDRQPAPHAPSDGRGRPARSPVLDCTCDAFLTAIPHSLTSVCLVQVTAGWAINTRRTSVCAPGVWIGSGYEGVRVADSGIGRSPPSCNRREVLSSKTASETASRLRSSSVLPV